MTILIVSVLVVALCLAAAWAARHVRHPENTAPRQAAGDSTSDRFYSRVDRPAGPDAEDPVGGATRFERDVGGGGG